ncbi:MAG: chalcone isomerase family protein [Gammaproteobacteria bacterium]|nr:chalcone isomerase family protein [Gammaproteobacteria bacterium]
MHKSAIILLFCLFIANSPIMAKEVEGIAIPDTLAFANIDSSLLLNGAGIREKFFLDIYIGALYLPARTPDASAILSDTGPASVLMHILYGEVSKEKITEGWTDGLKANLSDQEMQTLKPQLEKFNDLFQDLLKGDQIRIDYIPGIGTEVRINAELRGVVEGNDFYRSLLGIWIGPHPVTKSLKRAMLGND